MLKDTKLYYSTWLNDPAKWFCGCVTQITEKSFCKNMNHSLCCSNELVSCGNTLCLYPVKKTVLSHFLKFANVKWYLILFHSCFSVHSTSSAASPPTGPHYVDMPYRSDRRPNLGKSSTLPAQENTTPGRCSDIVSLPGGATPTHTYHQRWSNPGDISPAWGTIQHTCRRPLTEYRLYSHDFPTPNGKECEGRQKQAKVQDDSLKHDCKPQIPPKVPRSITDVDLLEPNVSFFSWVWFQNHYSVQKTHSLFQHFTGLC